MNRREILKAMAMVPLTNALAGCRESPSPPASERSPSARVHTLQILFEGAFALVLRKDNPSRLIAFVPRADHGNATLAHDFFFNDPLTARPASKGAEGYHFQLADDGLRPYAEAYVNPGFADFEASTEKWHLPERAVTVELPFPNSVNFSGRPLHVKFVSGKSGLMPTNHLLEYYVEDPEKIKLMCSQLEGRCQPSPNCPPGIVRFFFGVSPQNKSDGQKHAVDFFNFMLRTSFPDLEKRYQLSYIEASEEKTNPGAVAPSVRPAIYNSTIPAVRLLRTAAVLDCQSGGLLVHTNTGPTG